MTDNTPLYDAWEYFEHRLISHNWSWAESNDHQQTMEGRAQRIEIDHLYATLAKEDKPRAERIFARYCPDIPEVG